MNVDFRQIDDWFVIHKPVDLSYTSIASAFFGIGMVLILTEAVFYEYFSDLANSSFTTRNVIGFHLFPSEIWFIFFGNALLFLIIGSDRFRISTAPFRDVGPIFLVLGVYSLWFVYGSQAGNSWALREFREMVFTALSLPPILFFGYRINPRRVVRKFIVPGTVAVLAASVISVENTALMLATFFVSYYVLRLLFGNVWSLAWFGLVSLAFLLKFSKPMIVLFVFCVGLSFLLASYLNPKSINWILSKFKIRVVLIGLAILGILAAGAYALNWYLGGLIEQVIRVYFLKERLGSGGGVVMGDLTGGRMAMWKAAIESWLNRPLLGHGLGAEIEAYSKGWVTATQFHNYTIQALHNTGLVGLALIASGWTTWLFRTFRKVSSVADLDDRIVMGSMLAYVCGLLFFGMYGHAFSYSPSTQFFWICVGLLCVPRQSSTMQYRL